MRILLVDDDLEDRQAFAEAIKKLKIDIQLTEAKDCHEMFDCLERSNDIQLLLLDINMPRKNGKLCLKDLKTHEKYASIPVVVYTVSLNERDIQDAYDHGAHYYVVKPYAHLNFPITLKSLLEINWTQSPPVPPRERFVINLAF